VHQALMYGWIFAPPIHVFLSHGTFGRPSYQSENHHDSTNERSLKLRYRGCSVLSTRKSKVRAFSSCAIRSNRHTAMITAAMVPMMSTDQPNARIHTSKATVQGSRGNQDPSTQAAIAVMVIVMIDAWCASSHRSERVYQHRRKQPQARLRSEFIGV